VVGAIVPIILTLAGFLLRATVNSSPSGFLGTTLWVLTWIVWPSWVVLIDTEHTVQLIIGLLVSAVLNGFWYAFIGLLIWRVRHREQA
jgi:hypothetical protein